MNDYGYMVVKNKAFNMPLHIVEAETELFAGVAVFSSAKDARHYILTRLNGIPYNPDYQFCGIPKLYIDAKDLFTDLENRQMYTSGHYYNYGME